MRTELHSLLEAVKAGDLSASAAVRDLLQAREARDPDRPIAQDQYERVIRELVAALEQRRGPYNAVLFALDGAYSVTALPAVLSFIERALGEPATLDDDARTAVLNGLNIVAKMREIALGAQAEALLRRAASSTDETIRDWAEDLLDQEE